MNFQEEVNKIRQSLTKAEDVLVALSQAPDLDAIASGLALYLGILKFGKKATIFCEDEIKVEFSNLIGINKITKVLGGRNFVISLDYKEGAIDKVSYNIENDKFNLVIQSRPGAPSLKADDVTYTYAGVAADLIFTINTFSLRNLGQIYEQKKDLFAQEKIINIDRQVENEKFGQINLVIPQAASTGEIITLLLRSLGIGIDKDIGTNLLLGITKATNNFSSPKTNATSFEAAALALRAGAKRIQDLKAKKKDFPFKVKKQTEEKVPFPSPVAKVEEGKEEKAPPEWLKPKIYKGSTLV